MGSGQGRQKAFDTVPSSLVYSIEELVVRLAGQRARNLKCLVLGDSEAGFKQSLPFDFPISISRFHNPSG